MYVKCVWCNRYCVVFELVLKLWISIQSLLELIKIFRVFIFLNWNSNIFTEYEYCLTHCSIYTFKRCLHLNSSICIIYINRIRLIHTEETLLLIVNTLGIWWNSTYHPTISNAISRLWNQNMTARLFRWMIHANHTLWQDIYLIGVLHII